jgi:hypothetical protein
MQTNALMLLEKAQEELLEKYHLETAMDSVGLKHVRRDTVDHLCQKITTCWPRTRREIPSQTGVKRLQAVDAHDSQKQKKNKMSGKDSVACAILREAPQRVLDSSQRAQREREHGLAMISHVRQGKTDDN